MASGQHIEHGLYNSQGVVRVYSHTLICQAYPKPATLLVSYSISNLSRQLLIVDES